LTSDAIDGRQEGIVLPTKVLYIEDSPEQADIVTQILEHQFEDIEVQTASDGWEGLNKARIWQPDLILLDLMMPRTDGVEVLHRIRRDNRIKDIPVVVLSAWVGPGSQASHIAEQAGADAVFAKPVEVETLVNIVARYARSYDSGEATRATQEQ
jgi:CheY-like chemotaxis protein